MEQIKESNLKKSEFVRYLLVYDELGRLIDKQEVFATKDAKVIDKINREINSNLATIQKEKELAAIEENKKKLDEAFITHYSLKKLIECVNYALPRGIIPSEQRTLVNDTVNNCLALEKNSMERAEAIHELVENDALETFRALFEGMED